MSMLGTMNKTEGKVEDEQDRVAGGFTVESGLYDATIEMAYVHKSSGGAMGVTIHYKLGNGQVIKDTQYVTSGDAKGNSKTYTKDGKKYYLPGYNVCNAVTCLAIGKVIDNVEDEEKVVKRWDAKEGKEMNMATNVLTALIGAEITVGILKKKADKNKKNDAGLYVATGETRDINEVDKVFRTADGLTLTEAKAEATEAVFKAKWDEANTGSYKDESTGAANGAGSGATAGAPGASSGKAAGTPAPLFT